MAEALVKCALETPLGTVVAEGDAAGALTRLYFPDTRSPEVNVREAQTSAAMEARTNVVVPPASVTSALVTLVPDIQAHDTPLGGCREGREKGGVDRCDLAGVPLAVRETLAATARQLGEYFARARHSFDLPLAPVGTPFQLAVWDELTRIPYGTTITYAELARRVDQRLPITAAQAAGLDPAGQPGGSLRIRAVGRANGSNPLWLLIPCHRVIGGGGRLTGYGGGLWRKERLLMLEGAIPDKLTFG